MSLGRNFHKALAASGFANLADGVMWVALPLLAVQLTRSPLLIAGVTVAARAPWLLLSLVAGALAERLDRRQTMIRVNLVRTVLLGGLALAVAADVASLAMLYAVALLLASPRPCSTPRPSRCCRRSWPATTSPGPTADCSRPRWWPTPSSARPCAACWPPPAWPSRSACPRPPTCSAPAAWP